MSAIRIRNNALIDLLNSAYVVTFSKQYLGIQCVQSKYSFIYHTISSMFRPIGCLQECFILLKGLMIASVPKHVADCVINK
jgi:hypothetical protein